MSRSHLPSLASLALSLALAAACSRESSVARLPAAQSSSTTAPATKPAPKPTPAPETKPTADNAATKAVPSDAPGAADALPAPAGATFLSGQTEAHRRSTLTPKVSSTVTRVHVRDGDIVKTGQALVTLDTRDFALRTEQAEAARDAAKVQLDSAKLDWNRTKALLDDKAVPQSQFDQIDARYKGAQAGLAQAQTAVAIGKKALADATIRAPFNGIIVKRLVNEGEYASVMPATPLVILEEVDPLDLRIQIPSTQLDNVKVGDALRVRFPATGQTREARLTRVVAAMDPRTRTFSAIAELPNHDHGLRSGLFAEVTLLGTATAESKPAKTKAARKQATASKEAP